MNTDLSDFSDGYFKIKADCKLVPAHGELADKILDLSDKKLSKALDLSFGKDSNSWDLYPFFSVLVTSNCNKNFDVFDPVELWRSRHSPKYKSVNWMHNQGEIIGHILDVLAVDADIKPIPDDTKEEDLPDTLHLITANCLFKVWEDPKKQAEINKVIADIEQSKIFVSMECLFKQFAFWLKNKTTGEQKLLPRNEETAFLTKHLRQYHGTGEYKNYILGRLLECITFSGVGLVTQPANPDSIISNDLNLFKENTNFSKSVYINLDQLNGELTMAEKTDAANVEDHPLFKDLKDKHERLQTDHAALNARCDDMKNKIDEIHSKTLADAEEEMSEAKKEKEAAEAKLAEVETSKASLVSELEKVKADLDAVTKTKEAYEEATKKANRTESLLKADKSLTKEAATALAEQFKDLHDTSFAAMVETLKGYAEKAPKPVTVDSVLSTAQVEPSPPLGAGPEASNFIDHVKAAFSKGGK